MKGPCDSLLHPLYVSPRMIDFNPFDPFPGSGRSAWKGPRTEPRSHAFDLTHVALDIALDEAKRSVAGTARLTLTAFPSDNGAREAVLDAFELRVSRVRLERGRRSRALRFRTEGNTLRVTLDRAYAAGETITLAITYAATPRKGLFFIQPDAAYPEKPWQVWSQGQAEDNHAWFPCIDGPDTKVTSEMRVTVAPQRVALSNGRLVKTTRDARGRRTFHWKHLHPHATYLIMLAVGDYRVRTSRAGKVALSFYEYPTRQRASRRLFGNTAAMVRFFSERFGYDYAWDKYAQVLLHDFTFGGMENTSATTITDRALLDDNALADYSFESLIAHELGHQWWGDLLTCRSWSDGWLNEGFATYCERLWDEHAHGADAAALAGLAELNQYMQQDAKQYRRPIVTRHYEKSNELFDRHLYEKGGLTLHLLRHVLGDAAFFRALTHYAHTNAHKTVMTADLEAAIRTSTGQSLTWFFDQWLHKAGYPELRVTRAWDPQTKVLTLRIEQRQATDDVTPLFRFPLDVEIDAGSARPRTIRFWVEKADESFHIPLPAQPRRVTLDPSEAVIKTIDYDRSTAELLAEVARARTVLRRMRATRELAAHPTPAVVPALRRLLTGDTQTGVRIAAAIALGEIGAAAPETGAVRALRAGLSNKSGLVRRAVIWGLAYANASDLESICSSAIEDDPSYLVVAMALFAVGHRRTPRAYDILTSVMNRATPNEIVRMAAFEGLGLLKDKRGLDLAIEWSAYGRPAGARDTAVKIVGALGKHFGGAEQVRARECLVPLLRDASFRTRLSAVRGLTLLGDRSVVDTMRQVQRGECLDQTVLALRDAIEELEGPAQK